jgi:uncharacterized protein with HEPN domain
MSLPENDEVRLRHMLDAAQQALLFCAGRSRADLDGDVMLRFALVHAITVVGEAAAKISTPTRDALPGIAWASIVGMRNRLVHAYFDIDADVLWASVEEGLPPLVAQLRAALGTAA